MRWHLSQQATDEAPLTSEMLRTRMAEGRLQPTDLVRGEGSTRWLPAIKIEGLFNPGARDWYYTRRGRVRGPVTLARLRELAASGRLLPDDRIRKAGANRWKRARKIVNLFPASGVTPPPAPRSPASRTPRRPRPSRPSRIEPQPESPRRPELTTAEVAAEEAETEETIMAPRTNGRLDSLASHVPTLVVSTMLLALTVVGSLWGMSATRGAATQAGGTGREPWDGLRPSGGSAPAPARDIALPRAVRDRDGEAAEPARDGVEPISVEAERRLGQAAHNAILRAVPVVETQAVRGRIEDASRSLFARRERKEIEYSLTILDTEEAFTFSHLGGYVYVSRGMLDLAADDAELRFAIGHELAHLDLKQGWARLSRAIKEARLRGEKEANLAVRLLALSAEGFDDAEEEAADARVVRDFIALKHSPLQCLSLPRRLAAYAQRHAFDRRQLTTDGEGAHSLPDLDHHRARATAVVRLARLESCVVRGFAVAEAKVR